MMRYFPLTERERAEMMASIGISSVDDLFSDIPSESKLRTSLNIPAAMSEQDLKNHINRMTASNLSCLNYPCFLGAGAYRHFIPAVVSALASRTEFVTAYTPYQPEISQGTLQAIFEYQSLMCQLTGMPVSNASLYDGAMATAEATLMAYRIFPKQNLVFVSRTVHPAYRQTVQTYCKNLNIHIEELPFGSDGKTDLKKTMEMMGKKPAAIIIQSPNIFGIIEDWKSFSQLDPGQTLLISVVAESLSMGILKSPGECGADIACGEAQSMGLNVSFGGPYLGFFTAKEKYLRFMPGRLVGMTKDTEGRRGFVNTLSTREQHIRREKATSNICTNQALCAMTAAIYMSTLGKTGLRKMAELNMKKSAYLKSKISKLKRVSIVFSSPTFNEFVVRLPGKVVELNHLLAQLGIIGGYDLSDHYPELGQSCLMCTTELTTKTDIDRMVDVLAKWEMEVHS